MTTIVAHVGDLHVNSSVGLMSPDVVLDDGQRILQSATQRWLWNNWLDYWKRTAEYKEEMQATVLGIINGDWGDLNRHSAFQLLEPVNRDVVLEMMQSAVQPMLEVCDKIVVVRGTEAHVGGVGWLENRAAKNIGAVENLEGGTHSWYIFRGEVDGVKLTSAHHPGTTSMRPWTAGNDANRRAAWDVMSYYNADWKPQLTLWGHYHHYADSYETQPIRAIYNRCWQVKTAYQYRYGDVQEDDVVGALWIFCSAGHYEVRPISYALPRLKPCVIV